MKSKNLGLMLGLPLCAAIAIGASLGCSSGSSSDGNSASGALRGQPIPSDFTFATNQAVDLSVSVPAHLLDERGVGGLEVSLASGDVVYRGPVRASEPLSLRVAVPSKEQTLGLTLFAGANSQKKVSAPIRDGKASVVFE